MNGAPDTAMVLAAGLGIRMRPITATKPKPLIEVAGKPLLDWGLDSLAEVGVAKAVVNVHYLPEQIVAHVSRRQKPSIIISDESEALLDSAGGIVKALPELGPKPFYVINADTFWVDEAESNLARLAAAWDASKMDMLLMLADLRSATGHSGGTDFLAAPDGRLSRGIFAGAAITKHSLNLYFDRAIAAGRLFGLRMNGSWITVGTPDALAPAEAAVARAQAVGA
jgi:MurNAc alpha-1-phosphate uridylyltransferase